MAARIIIPSARGRPVQVFEWQAPDPAEIEAALRATCVRLGLTAREAADVIRIHRQVGRRTIAAGMAATSRAVRRLPADRGEPWDEAGRRLAEEVGYANHVGGLILRRERDHLWW